MRNYRRILGALIPLFIFGGSFSISMAENGATHDLYPSLEIRGADFYQEQAASAYKQSGLSEYRDAATLLWTETLKRRTDLQAHLPAVHPQAIETCRQAIWQSLQKDPDNIQTLILAGHYLLWKGQYDSAVWNYRQALQKNPDSLIACLALADFYLTRWEPDQVIQLFRKPVFSQSISGSPETRDTSATDPEVALRIGAAYLQKNDCYQAALYLSQADPLPPGLQATRDKDLAKAFLGIGEFPTAKQLLQNMLLSKQIPTIHTIIQGLASNQLAKPGKYSTLEEPARILVREYLGWVFLNEGRAGETEKLWGQGRTESPGYRFFQSEFLWLKPDQTPLGLANPAILRNDSELKSQLNISQGLRFVGNSKQTTKSYESFLAGIKADHRSLIGFLEAARCRFQKKDYHSTVDLCNQGLAVNPLFKPLLEMRASAYGKLGKKEEAQKDQSLSKSISTQGIKSVKLSGQLSKTNLGRPFFLIQGETQTLSGVWSSPDGTAWQYQPWWGGPLFLTKDWPELWLLPVGGNLSGEALVIQSKSQNQPPAPSFDFPSTVAEKLANILIPFPKRDLKYHLSSSKPLTNRRELQLSLNQDSDSTPADYMAVFEKDGNGPWRKFTKEFSYTMTSGDGVKDIIVKLADRYGNTAEITTRVTLETSLPEVVGCQFKQEGDSFELSWQVNKPCRSQLEFYQTNGAWRTIDANAESEIGFQAQIPRYMTSFCRIISVDTAGNQTIYPVGSLNETLQADLAQRFEMSSITDTEDYQIFTIQPKNDFKEQWAVSADSVYWSGFKQANESFRWRYNKLEGTGLLFIKIKAETMNALNQYIAIPVPFPAKKDDH